MQRIALVVAGAAALSLAGASTAAATLTGTFTTRITGAPSAQLNGVWTMKIATGGRYTIALGKRVLITGRATVKAPRITFGNEIGPAACKGAQATGVYNYFLMKGKVLRFEALSDSCPGRRFVLSHQFTRVG
jgi:hypothetical protein